ncbi:unnamed protein product (macronuclear) [Paramecium tetraurelia]|uniref:Transmembrane protein n=1 Tax=Paramecium tetraurelia TaxID=5888 RepID=A0DAL5_PARTE|nr:uncharacterized protein GSPATT00014989001 [Paramecium tetraurelia]CAK80082.1 unnamed protein product [Paramecium tetraurelia]|eukprot:XP_001447479.1 hypothetical protein (macronuclear) [Paramecium tetraurelia strain d4-2]
MIKILILLAQFLEFLFSVSLCAFMKIGREETKMSGRVLKFAYRVEKNLLYNYEFGPNTKDIRLCLIPFLLPTIYKKIINIKSSFSFYELLLALIDVLSLVDYINTTESYQRYCLVYTIRVIRTMMMLFELVQEITKMVILHYEQILQNRLLYMQQKKQCIKNSNTQQQQILSIQQQQILNEESDSDEQTKLNNIKKQQQQQQSIIKRIIFPQMKIPCFLLNLIINQQQYYIQIIDPWSFDNSFSQISIREQLLIMIKLNYCCQIYQTLKKTKCNQKALHKYRELIAEYLSQLIWMN